MFVRLETDFIPLSHTALLLRSRPYLSYLSNDLDPTIKLSSLDFVPKDFIPVNREFLKPSVASKAGCGRGLKELNMSDDEADPELLALLRQSLGIAAPSAPQIPETRVLEGAEHVYDHAIDVAIDASGTKAAARLVWKLMEEQEWSTQKWSSHPLHPQAKNQQTVDFIFAMDVLNFSFWSERPSNQRFAVEYRGERWVGYWSLVASLQRALDEGIPITSSDFWQNESECTEDLLRHVFRSATDEEMPLIPERLACLQEAGKVLYDKFECSFANCIAQANGSAAALVNLVVDHFQCFRDEVQFEGQTIRFYKRAQILVADLWACFDGQDFGSFDDITKLTIFPDYRIPQMLHQLGCLRYSPRLESFIRRFENIEARSRWEIELRGSSIWCVELMKRQILRESPEAKVNAVLIDFFLYDTIKEREAYEIDEDAIPHHRTRSIWY